MTQDEKQSLPRGEPTSADSPPADSPSGTLEPAKDLDPSQPATTARETATRRHLRGSSLLLVGRLFALLVNFSVQVLTVRYLLKADYGAFAYALAVVSMAGSVNLLGLQRAVNRFVPLYHERRDYGSMFGTILLATGSIVGFGLALVILTFGLRGVLTTSVVNNPLSVGLLLILIALSPLQSLDSLCQGVVAALASPRAIFFRRHVLGPCLRLAAVLLVLVVQGSVHLLATCYLAAGFLGVVIYALVIHRVLRQQGLLRHFQPGSVRWPVREIFGFSLPLMSTDVVLILKTTMAVMILEHFRGSSELADFRVVVPVAGLNIVVLQSFKLLFMPAATRLYERRDTAGINDIYWQSAIWTTIVTFPVFAVCFFLAEPVTTLLFGDRYAASNSAASSILAILAVGSYFSAAMGLNTYCLQVYARVRFITSINALATTAGLLLNLWLIPKSGEMGGAVGAAIATTASVVLHNVLNHVGLFWRTDIDLFRWRGWKVYLTVLSAVLALYLVCRFFEPSVAITVSLVVLASLVLIRINRHSLDLEQTFPELSRVPLLREFLSLERRR